MGVAVDHLLIQTKEIESVVRRESPDQQGGATEIDRSGSRQRNVVSISSKRGFAVRQCRCRLCRCAPRNHLLFANQNSNRHRMKSAANPCQCLLSGLPWLPDISELRHAIVRYYPYYWGRKGNWDDRYPLADADPLFADFLRAGAARIVVPVHPGYPEAMLHFMHTAEIWNGGEPPTIDDPLYVSIIDELRGDAQINDDGDDLAACSIDSTTPCFVDEWEVKLPTTLVYLQQDPNLPVLSTGETAPVDLAAKLDQMVEDSGQDLDWRQSVVDLLKLLGRDSSYPARKAMALAHGCPTSGSAAMNICLKGKIMTALAVNGALPADF